MNKLMEKLSGLKEPEMDEEDDVPAKEEKSDEAEVLAMKLFMKADTPEAKAKALKKFLDACGY